MDYRCPLAWSLGVDFHGLLLGAYPIAEQRSRRDEARDICQWLRPAQCLEVLIKNLIDRRRTLGLLDNVFWLFRRRAIERGQIRGDPRLVTTAMTGITRDHLSSIEIGLIDGAHHENHPA